MTRYHTPLRYPGGKGRLSRFMQLVLQQNKLGDAHYAEPYCGGSGVAFPLLFLQYASYVHLNDFSRPIYLFWNAVLHHTEALCEMIDRADLNIREWRKQRRIYRNPRQYTDLEIAFATFFMNRCNRSGILDGGVIGGKNQRGKWKLNARFNKPALISRITRIGQQRNRISLYNLDAEQFLNRTKRILPDRTLIYLDPPYFAKGAALYEDHYTRIDHDRLAKFVQSKIRHHWIVSYDDRPEIRRLYKQRRSIRYCLNYSAGLRQFGTEVMFFSDGLVVPKVINPVRLSPNIKGDVIPARYSNLRVANKSVT